MTATRPPGRVQALTATIGHEWTQVATFVSAGYSVRMRYRFPGFEWRRHRDDFGYWHVSARRRRVS